MEENRSIIRDVIQLNSKELYEIEDSTLRVFIIYSRICDELKKDHNYGEKFVKDNQVLIGQLVQSTIIDIHLSKSK
jgi:hypothetical protein